MFGMSIGKLAVLIAIILAVWYGFKWVARYNQVKQSAATKRDRGPESIEAEDMVRCERCGAFYPAAGGHDCSG